MAAVTSTKARRCGSDVDRTAQQVVATTGTARATCDRHGGWIAQPGRPGTRDAGHHHVGEEAAKPLEQLHLIGARHFEVLAPRLDPEQRNRHRHEGERGQRRRRDDAPCAERQEGKRQHEAEMRLEGQEAEQDAGQDRPPVDRQDAADQQRRGEKTFCPPIVLIRPRAQGRGQAARSRAPRARPARASRPRRSRTARRSRRRGRRNREAAPAARTPAG